MNAKQPECWSLDPRTRGLRVELSPQHSLILPYEHFVYSEFVGVAGTDTLKVLFASHEVTLRGQQLRRVETAIQRMELGSVSAVSEKHRSLVSNGQPCILEIEVRSSQQDTAGGSGA